MAGPFGRGSSRSRSRYQSGGSSCTSNKKRLASRSKDRAVKKQPPPTKDKCLPLKAGTEKPQQGPESGSSKESSSPSPFSSTSRHHSPKFETCRRRRRRRRRARRRGSPPASETPLLPSTVTVSSPARSKPAFLSKIGFTAITKPFKPTKETILLPIFFYLFNLPGAEHRICKKNGREPPPSS